MQYRVGDRVIAIQEYDRNKNIINQEGIIIDINYDLKEYGVKFNNHIDGHDLNRRCEDGHGWWVLSSRLKLININHRVGGN